MRATPFLLASIVLVTLLLPVTAQAATAVTAPPPPGLLLWNKLGSDDEVLHSAAGPNLGFFVPADCEPDCEVDVQGTASYSAGVFGGATTIGGGPYSPVARVHAVVLRNPEAVLNPERGAIELWYKQLTDPVPFLSGIYRLFGGFYGLDDTVYFVGVGPDPAAGNPDSRMTFGLAFGGAYTAVTSGSDHRAGVNISTHNGSWIHLAGVWDRAGVAGTTETIRLYLNGVEVASGTGSGWGTNAGACARPALITCPVDIAGGNDEDIAGKFFVDNVKVWNYAKTDFSDRFVEGFGGNLCNGKAATIAGTPGPDFINGTAGPDVIVGLGGNDKIRGLGGNDTICGNGGADELFARGGVDAVFGGAGNDLLHGGIGNDLLSGGGGNDAVYGDEDDDRLFGNLGDDLLHAGPGDDRLDGGPDTDICNGGLDTDTAANCEKLFFIP
jgi:Ca2+-binding RTX toxin-like protein